MSEFLIPREDFVAVERSPASAEHEIIIAVKKSNIDEIERIVLDRASPENEQYQQWLSLEEIDRLLEDTQTSAKHVLQWCKQQDLHVVDITRRHDYIRVAAPIHRWESLLKTKFYLYEDLSYPDENRRVHENTGSDDKLFESTRTKSLFHRSMKAEDSIKMHKKDKRRSVHTVHRAEHYTIPVEIEPFVVGMANTVQTPPAYTRTRHGVRLDSDDGDETEVLVAQLQKQWEETLQTMQQDVSSSLRGSSPLSPAAAASSPLPQIELRILDGATPAAVTIPFLNRFYHVDSNAGLLDIKQSVFATNNEYFSTNDLSAFQRHFDLQPLNATAKNGHALLECPAGGKNATVSCNEGNLDVQYMMGMAQNTTTVFWWVPSQRRTGVDPFTFWSVLVANETDPPSSHAIAWGSMEVLQSPLMMTLFNTEAMILAARGVTIVVSSGDDGAPNFLTASTQYNVQADTCLCEYNSGSSELRWGNVMPEPFSGEGYFPSFPATSPYVTAVGATMLGGPQAEMEIAAQAQEGGIITSGGGFSVFFATPVWQRDTVRDYLATHAPSSPGFNRHGRGYPDLSLLGVEYEVMMNGALSRFFGTSLVAPVLAGWVSLVNAQRRRAGANNSTLGWMNPTLYAMGHNASHRLATRGHNNVSFNDVISGHNRCCHASGRTVAPTCCASGFEATCGWDAVTGWGSINYPAFEAMFMPPSATAAGGEGDYFNANYSCVSARDSTQQQQRNTGLSIASSSVVVTVVAVASFLVVLSAAVTLYVYNKKVPLWHASRRSRIAPSSPSSPSSTTGK